VKSELFHYEVARDLRHTEVADNRRIVNDAIKQAEQGSQWQNTSGTEDADDAPECDRGKGQRTGARLLDRPRRSGVAGITD